MKLELEKLDKIVKKNHTEIMQIELDLNKSKDPSYIELQAREKLDLVGQDDLVFIFPGEESVSSPVIRASKQ